MVGFTFKRVKGSSKYLAWKLWEQEDYLIGKFEGQSEDKFGNPSYRTTVIESSLEDVNEGDTFTLNSNGSLNYKMEDITVGSVIRVEYQGKELLDNPKSPFDGKEFHKVELELAEIGNVQEEIEDDGEL
jgi:hypothetical protein